MIQCFHFKNQYLHYARNYILHIFLTLRRKSLDVQLKNIQGIHGLYLKKNLVEIGDRGENAPLRCSWLGVLSLPRTGCLESSQAKSLKLRVCTQGPWLSVGVFSKLSWWMLDWNPQKKSWGGGSVQSVLAKQAQTESQISSAYLKRPHGRAHL